MCSPFTLADVVKAGELLPLFSPFFFFLFFAFSLNRSSPVKSRGMGVHRPASLNDIPNPLVHGIAKEGSSHLVP